jgi:hypothetical protein
MGPLERETYPLAGHFYISLNIYLIVFLSESPVWEPPPISLTGSPRTGILRHQSHWPSEGSSVPNILTFDWKTSFRNFQRFTQRLLNTVLLNGFHLPLSIGVCKFTIVSLVSILFVCFQCYMFVAT